METVNTILSVLNLLSGYINLYLGNKMVAGFNFTVSVFCGVMAVSNAI